MSEFIDECRREWKRLRVPDPLASEMAADLAADLREAEAEGASPEAVLGSSAFDPRTFAASWATERGLVQRRFPLRSGSRRLLLSALALVVVLIAAVVTVMLVTSSQSAGAPVGTVRQPSATVVSIAIPNLIGLQRVDAVAQAQSAGPQVRVSARRRGTSPAGMVVAQRPAAGVQVAKGSVLLLVVKR